jgi:hypothetical protein
MQRGRPRNFESNEQKGVMKQLAHMSDIGSGVWRDYLVSQRGSFLAIAASTATHRHDRHRHGAER